MTNFVCNFKCLVNKIKNVIKQIQIQDNLQIFVILTSFQRFLFQTIIKEMCIL